MQTQRPDLGMGILVVRDQQVLLGKRRSSQGADHYAAAGEHIEWGESLAAAAHREVLEETGLTITNVSARATSARTAACDSALAPVKSRRGKPSTRRCPNDAQVLTG